jgi:hypothetical protein
MEKLLPLFIVLAVILGISGIAVLGVRWARKSSRRAALLGWGLQFLGAGANPVPPPQGQARRSKQPGKTQEGCGFGRSLVVTPPFLTVPNDKSPFRFEGATTPGPTSAADLSRYCL